MGVVCVYYYPVPEGKSGQQVVDGIQKQIELLGAVKTGNFCVDCETFQAGSGIQNTPQRQVNILHSSEQPASCFAILDTGTCLVADALFDGLMQKLKHYYQQRKGSKIESKGQRYEYGDFIFKVGSVSQASNFKGILIEIEYCPCVVAGDCMNLMKEMSQSLLGSAVAEQQSSFLKTKTDMIYTPADTMSQYLEHFNNFKKATSVNQAMNR
ncbi:mediator of RNA polymerase II transcription subunit 20 isoform X2 [Patella vulgata]|uniref:mediator of RNA polymerase II transcription subunit 20 isoform X2 n=1 Tax=Patella vulgata TaxID=6465 RepID=UPI00217FA41A|nr:mediator of RNA polymerase II transcription subunit 20 isoform X2 [Patella vulgata]